MKAKLLLAAAVVAVVPALLTRSADAQEGQSTAVQSPQVVLDWNATAVATVLAARKPSPEALVYLGLVQAAVHDAVVAIEGGFEPYLIVPGVPPTSSAEAAGAAAAYGVLARYFPAQKAMLDDAYASSLAGIPDGPAEDRGVLVGQQVATGIVAARIDDGRDAPVSFSPTASPGVWRPTPPAFLAAAHPWLPSTKPLALESPSQFRPDAPPVLDSRRYARDVEETRLYGAKTGSLRTAAQTETALFWAENTPTQYNRTLRNLVTARSLDLREAARTLALGGIVLADAMIACFDAKQAYAYWRPVTAIREADTDGNERTTADPTWEPLAATPNHAEYPSAHTCATAALGNAVAEIVGDDDIELDVASTVTNTTRHFDDIDALRQDIVDARVYIGFHFRTANEVGYRLGEKVSRWVIRHHLRATRGRTPDDG